MQVTANVKIKDIVNIYALPHNQKFNLGIYSFQILLFIKLFM